MAKPKAKSKKRIVTGHKLSKKHANHDQHLCDLVAKRDMNKVADLAGGAKYMCYICGRGAAKASNLCEPVEV